jgi:hypothetical protein
VRLFATRSVRRHVGLAILLFFTVPFGLSVVGCGHKNAPPVYCNTTANSGPVVGQVQSIVLSQNLSVIGESLNYGQIGPSLSATAYDCQHNNVSVSHFTYATTDMNIADVNPSNGTSCGGMWNRNSGSGIPDFTICNAPASTPSEYEAFITANANGVTSNAIPVFVHPTATAVELATPESSTNSCPSNPTAPGADPTTDCCTANITTTPEAPATAYDGSFCVSQNHRAQIAAKVYANGTNISCQVGHVTFNALGATNIVSIDPYGFATAGQPGSATITATIANSSTASNAGFFSTCPPASIQLTSGGGTGPFNVGINNTLPLTATVLDTNGNQITGLALEFNSTTPQTISAASGSVLPTFPGSADITAVCQPGTCNPSPLAQIGYLGNGKPLTSNGITVNASGTSGTVLYMASTDSQYVVPYDFTLNQQGSPIKLPYVPNSMVMSQDGSTLYFGSPQGLMTLSTAGNTVSAANQLIPGTVLAVSPSGAYVVITDPTRQTVSLVTTNGIATSYGNVVGTSAAWSPDSNTLYVTTNTNELLTYSAFNNWQVTTTNVPYSSVTVTVPHVGAYFAGGTETPGRSYCSNTTISSPAQDGNPPVTTNLYYPLADVDGAQTQVVAATTDGNHILGAGIESSGPVLSDIKVVLPVTQPCPMPPQTVQPGYFTSTFNTYPLSEITVTPQQNPAYPSSTPGIIPQGITGVVPASNSALAFVTYNGSSGILPEYIPSTGAIVPVHLGNGATPATAPLAGVFSTDNLNFYAGASDGQVHLISINGTTATETGVLKPSLTPVSGSGSAPVNLIAQHPKKTQS